MTTATMSDGVMADVGTTKPGRRKRSRIVLFILAVMVVIGVRPVSEHVRAAQLLMTFSDKDAHPNVSDERITFLANGQPVAARVYRPVGVAHAPAVVLVHGVNHFGIDDPRLERFARAVSSAGVTVMTPAIKELSDYHVAASSIDTVGAAVVDAQHRFGDSKVGLMGMSFGGGISLLAAADPRFADRVSFVVAVGAHDDLGRVSRFFVTDEIPHVDGGAEHLKAHGYGMMVLVYSHVEDFFPAADVDAARESLRLWIWEDRDGARKEEAKLSPESKAKLDKLFGDGAAELRPEMMAVIARNTDSMVTVSPHGHLAGLKANVYLLHGAGDTVVPASESEWLAADVPADRLKQTLITSALEHVDFKDPSARSKWELVHFMGEVLADADRE